MFSSWISFLLLTGLFISRYKWQVWTLDLRIMSWVFYHCAPRTQLGNCNIHPERNISFVNETKWYEIWLKLKGWLQKIFQILPQNFIPFPWTKESKMKPKFNLCLKSPFSANHPNWGNIYLNLKVSWAKFNKIFQSFPILNKLLVLYEILWYLIIFNKISWYYTILNINFTQFCSISKFCAFSFPVFKLIFATFQTLSNFQNFGLIIRKQWRRIKESISQLPRHNHRPQSQINDENDCPEAEEEW